MLGRRMGRRGLLGAAATTAVVVGTAGAVSGSMQSKNAAKAQQVSEAQAYEQEQQQAQINAAVAQAVAAQQAAAPGAPAAADQESVLEQLQNLAAMHTQGILSDEEFAAAKAKVLA
ncbi:MAG TPA: SHOCT domain-containing protein [Microbacteriaceae bacterium]